MSRVREEALAPLPSVARGRGGEVWHDDMVAALLSALLMAGLFLDGWNHLNLQDGRLGSFFTPWHGLLYAGFTANTLWVISRNRHLWRSSVEPDPALHKIGALRLRYPFAVIGLFFVGIGMVGDIGWHTLFGEEGDVARVIAPFHIALFAGASLLVAAPLRSAWHAPDEYPRVSSRLRLAPAILSLALLSAAASFMLQWLSPFMDWTGGGRPDVEALALGARDGLQATMAARVAMATVVLLAPIMFASRRWVLPFGTAAIIFTFTAVAMSSLSSFDLVDTAIAALLGGLAIDLALLVSPHHGAARLYIAAGVGPAICWATYFLVLHLDYGADWPADFALGTASLTALVGVALAFFLTLPEAEPLSS